MENERAMLDRAEMPRIWPTLNAHEAGGFLATEGTLFCKYTFATTTSNKPSGC
jgi:hypothetical protein